MQSDFGSALAVRGSGIFVGASEEEISGYARSGAAYVYVWTTELEFVVRYDSRVDGSIRANTRFGQSVGIGPGFYLVGAPGAGGQIYSIPFGTPEPADPIPPPDVTLEIPGGITASDGTTPDRIQVRWSDDADEEDGYLVYRSTVGGEFERLAEVSANVEFYDDFAAAPGDAYTYCVSAFAAGAGGSVETDRACDIGWRPANGTIAGRVAVSDGAGTDEAEVCLVPDPNRGLLFDGVGGYVEAALTPDEDGLDPMSLTRDFTIEVWIRPQETSGSRYVIARDSAYTLAVVDGDLRFTLVELPADTTEFNAGVALQTGTWYHVAMVRENNDVNFYLDGAPVSTIVSGKLAKGGGRDTLSIGQSLEWVGTDTGWFEGEIDEVRIWSVARDSAQIHDERRAALTGKEEGLVGYWPLNQGRRLVVPDLTASANHGRLLDGIYVTDEGAELKVCAVTGSDGNYSISGIRYGESTEFDVIPSRPDREFTPSFKKITLSTESPVQNEVFFSDVTAFPVSGFVLYEDVVGLDTLTCPVPDVVMHVAKDKIPGDDNIKDVSGADGGYSVAVDPSVDDNDTWFFIPQYESPADDELVHTFTPNFAEIPVTAAVSDLNFTDQTRQTLSGYFTGGNPETCAKDIGTATIVIRTENGCYNRTLTVHSGPAGSPLGDDEFENGFFSVDLPPLSYLVEVVNVEGAPSDREEDITEFFDKLGAVEVDLTVGDVERNLIYRAPLSLRIASYPSGVEWGENAACPVITQRDDGAVIRTLPSVPIIPEFGGEALEISVIEDYGDGNFCKVEEGTVTIFDAISDRVDADSTLTLGVDSVYTVVGASPNIFSGARIQGVDRSFQKPITVVAQIEGRPSLTETRWAIVEGARERAATFVSATTEEFPLLMLHDPPGSNSYSFIEEGTTMCSSISNTRLTGGGAGPDIDVMLGFKADTGFSFGAHFELDGGGGALFRTRTIFGRDNGSLNECLTVSDLFGEGVPPEVGAIELPSSPLCGPSLEVCMTTTESIATSNDMTWAGEDIHVGVALNLIFAIADVLEEANSCELNLSETLAADLDQSDPFETAYVYGESHIRLSLIPELENLIRLAGDATLTGEIDVDGD
ncbi:MAG: LamG domain-containing protein, partial [Rhodothermales bacterium]|nr:LamG domain-containing protein [Rhodothermales bacterium]